MWLFEVLKNHQFWYFKYFKINEPSIPVLWKKSNKKIVNLNYFQNLKEPMIFMKESLKDQGFYGWSFYFSKFWESWLYTKIKSLIFLKIMIINLKNHPNNLWGFVPIFSTQATRYQHTLPSNITFVGSLNLHKIGPIDFIISILTIPRAFHKLALVMWPFKPQVIIFLRVKFHFAIFINNTNAPICIFNAKSSTIENFWLVMVMVFFFKFFK